MIGCGDGCGASGTDRLTNSRRGSVTVFEAACKMGLEGIVSKRRYFPHRNGKSKGWINKNPASPAIHRLREWSW